MTAILTRALTDPINALRAGQSSSMRQLQAVVTAQHADLGTIDVTMPGLDAAGNQILAPVYNVRCTGGLPAVGSTTTLLATGQGRLISLGVAGVSTDTGTPGTPGGGGTSRVLATWSALGYVLPHDTTIIAADDAGTLTGVHLTVGIFPARSLIVDVQVAPPAGPFASIYASSADFPTFTHAQTNPLLVPVTPAVSFAAESLFRVTWVNGGGAYDATAKLLG